MKLVREAYAAPVASAGIERLFYRAGKMHDDLKKRTSETTLERNLKVGLSYTHALLTCTHCCSTYLILTLELDLI